MKKSVLPDLGIIVTVSAGVALVGSFIWRKKNVILDDLDYYTSPVRDELSHASNVVEWRVRKTVSGVKDATNRIIDDTLDKVEDAYIEQRDRALDNPSVGFKGRVKEWFYRFLPVKNEQDFDVVSNMKTPVKVDPSVVESIRNRRYEDDIHMIRKSLSPEGEVARRKWREDLKKAQEEGVFTGE